MVECSDDEDKEKAIVIPAVTSATAPTVTVGTALTDLVDLIPEIIALVKKGNVTLADLGPIFSQVGTVLAVAATIDPNGASKLALEIASSALLAIGKAL